jgi:hypothetical protein
VVLLHLDAAENNLRLGVISFPAHSDGELLERVIDVLGQLGVFVEVDQMGSSPVLSLLLGLQLLVLGLVRLLLFLQFLLEVLDVV